MKPLLQRCVSSWPCWLAWAYIALLPFRRLSEVPLSLFALSLVFLARSADGRARIQKAATFLLPLFLCYWVPMLVSSVDSVAPEKSWTQSLAALRFLAAGLALSLWLQPADRRHQFLRWTAWLLLFWAFDGFVQLLLGHDLLGIPQHPDRLNALFADHYQFFGPTLAMLSPLVLEHARRNWPVWGFELAFALLLGAVLIAGMRAGWLAMGLVCLVYLILAFRPAYHSHRRALITIPAIAVIVLLVSTLSSPLLQERIDVTRAFATGADRSLDLSALERAPLFRAAVLMYRDHPVNGVGVRGYPYVYSEYAEPDDVHVAKAEGPLIGSHAHNIVLEVAADTGSLGLLGLLLATIFAIRFQRRQSSSQRLEAFPFVLAVVLIVFPFNSHFAIYGTYTSSLIWFLMGLWGASLQLGAAGDIPLRSSNGESRP